MKSFEHFYAHLKRPRVPWPGFFLRFRFGDRKEILRDRLEEFERPFSIDVISGHYILRDRWRNLRDRFGPSKHHKKNTVHDYWDQFIWDHSFETTVIWYHDIWDHFQMRLIHSRQLHLRPRSFETCSFESTFICDHTCHSFETGTPERGCITGHCLPWPLKGGQRGHRCPFIPVS